jgi:hypothetical protein
VNTFALILLAFPLYLAVNGKLTDYTALVTTAAPAAPAAPATPATPATPAAPAPTASN